MIAEINKKLEKRQMRKIRIGIFLSLIITTVFIVASGLVAGTFFLRTSITKAVEADLLIAVDVADQFVTNEISLLKFRAADAAKEIKLNFQVNKELSLQDALEYAYGQHSIFIGMAVFDEQGLLALSGESPVSGDLHRELFMRFAFNGGQAVSTTMYAPDGALVMYVSAPISEGLVLAAVLPGLFFSDLISKFTFWETGHLFIDDKDGYVISNYRREWVEERINFTKEAMTNDDFAGASEMVKRGISDERGIGHFKMGGVPRISAFRPVSSENENWFIGIVAPIQESALASIPSGIILVAAVMLLMSLIAVTIASWFLKRPYEKAVQLREAAEIASISKSTFLANMSHEIRTPMNSILGFSELAADAEIPEKTRDYLTKIHENTEWLLEIINDILDISKIESGKMELEHIPFDLSELLQSCKTLILPKAAEKGILLHFYAEPNLERKLLGDPTRLRQVFVNLLSNAVKFTNSGIIKLDSVVKEKTEKTITIYFEVKDSGIGMTPEQIKKIFSPFTQGESGTTRKFGGSGLGLSITKNIVEMMGGKLSVDSAPGIGSKFSFYITFDTIILNEKDIKNNNISFNEIKKPAFKGEVLLCEDNSMNQQVICEHLDRVGLKTVVAENGKVGVDIIKSRKEKGEKQFDLILMDIHMPVMDGLEAASKILELNINVPIVAMTANILVDETEVYKSKGINDYLGKPFTSQELWRCLMKYFTQETADTAGKNSVSIELDMDFQRKIQELFFKNNKNKYDEVINAIKEGDIKTAHRLAHTLKSNAGQIGKKKLQQAAAVIENQLKDGINNASEEQLKVMNVELQSVIDELSSLFESQKNDEKQVHFLALEREKALELLNKLEPILKYGSPESIKFLEELRGVKDSSELIQQINDFEFEKAYATLLLIKSKFSKKE